MSDNDSDNVTWEPIHSTPTANRDASSLIEEEERETLSRIATSLRSRSLSIHDTAAPSKNPALLDQSDPELDPTSPKFDLYKWAQATIDAFDKTGFRTHHQGVLFRNLTVSGSGAALQFQQTVGTTLLFPFFMAARAIQGQTKSQVRSILHSFDGVLRSGELLLVLGRPGSGCSTFLKTITGHLDGLELSQDSGIHYNGLDLGKMVKEYRGEVAYNQEVDIHFPHLTVGETLEFAGYARAPQQRGQGMSRDEYVKTVVQVIMAVFGLSHTYNTKVGNDFVRGVSGGERKRVSIAEMALSRAKMGAWDNSTRGLDSSNALQFIKSLRVSADLRKSCHAVAAYQASQSMYDLFDKVVVLYDGREIYFGPCGRAVQYFEDMGWEKPLRQVSGDFLTAITNPGERKARQGMEDKVPRSAAEFEAYWRNSSDYQQLKSQMAAYEEEYPLKGEAVKEFQASKQAQQARHVRPKSPYLLSVPMQIRLCIRRAFQRLRNDLPTTLSTVFVQVALSLIIGSIFYNSPNSSSAFFQKGAVLYFAVLMNALLTINEIMQLYAQRPVVEKQAGYAFAHPFTEALASILIDLPIKFARCAVFSIILYFMANLRREPSQFFIFFLFLFTTIIAMSGVFRSLAAMTKTIGQAMALAGVMVICMVVYAGFTLPQPYMHPWLSWIRWINPIFYSFEAIIANEFHGREFECAQLVPDYPDLTGNSFICSAVGAIAGQRYVSGDQFIAKNYHYYYNHVWRNYGILIGFLVFFNVFYLVVTELRTGSESKAECLIFRPGHAPRNLLVNDLEKDLDGEGGSVPSTKPGEGDSDSIRHLPKQTDVFSWRELCYDIPVKEGTRRLLDNVNGWVKPGTLTALMGASGAGKTTLLDVLAQRVSIGVVTGNMLVNGKGASTSFQRKTGYVQQQDLHLETTTVREALRFSALLRQPKSVTKKEKLEFVEDVIQMLDMNDFAEAVVGQPGEGLNVEQRKLLTIGVELAAKPTLLIFLDEATSGLDSQSSWAICSFMRKLADHGQAVLATIHQPSALLFQQFDRLLLLAKGGRTVYFGDIGEQSQIMLDYFEGHGARHCHESENPAEYILEIIGAGGGKQDGPFQDWVETWNNSQQFKEVLAELERIGQQEMGAEDEDNPESHREFAMPLPSQFYYVCLRVFQQYYRQPEYILAKFVLGIVSGLFIGFSFWKSDSSQQGFQNVLFSLFLMCTIFSTLVNQIMPKFLTQRTLYEVRERPSRVYSWKVFIVSQILVELPWQILLAVCAWASFYFSVFGAGQSSERKGLILLFIVQFYIFASSFAQLVISALPDATLAAMFATLMFALCLIFNGVMQPPDALPGFWIFMNRVSPLTYYISGISSTALHGRPIECSDSELSLFDPPRGQTCGQYLSAYLEHAAGRLYNSNATERCQYCPLSSADQYLAGRDISWDDRWRNYGIFWAYFGFNVLGAITLYYVFRVKKWSRK